MKWNFTQFWSQVYGFIYVLIKFWGQTDKGQVHDKHWPKNWVITVLDCFISISQQPVKGISFSFGYGYILDS